MTRPKMVETHYLIHGAHLTRRAPCVQLYLVRLERRIFAVRSVKFVGVSVRPSYVFDSRLIDSV
jgi:hypothetical protein